MVPAREVLTFGEASREKRLQQYRDSKASVPMACSHEASSTTRRSEKRSFEPLLHKWGASNDSRPAMNKHEERDGG